MSSTGSSNSPRKVTRSTLTGISNLIKLLPTGTVFVFQFLNPLLTINGHCLTINKFLSGILIAVCSFSCWFASFTDSYTDEQGNRHYGIVTTNGLWPYYSSPGCPAKEDLSYKLRFGDFVHAFLALAVFGVVVLLDPNTVGCFYPSFELTQKVLLMVLPPIVGMVCSLIFMVYPNNRHGIGYP